MRIFLKYVLKSMFEKKARFFLLLIAILLSTGLFVGSIGAVDSAIDSIVKPQLEQLENKDVYISSKNGDIAFNLDGINKDGIKDIVPEMDYNAIYDTDDMQSIKLTGRENEYINKDSLIEGKDLKNFEDEKCIISKRISDKFNLNLGDKLNLVLKGEKVKLEVAAISSNDGAFYTDTKDSFEVIVPYKYLSDKLNQSGKYNSVFASKTEDTIKDTVEKFNDANNKFVAKELYDEDAIKSQSSQLNSMLYMMLAIVVFMSSIIIYSSFKLTVTERMPVIGTFLSQGATRGVIRRILYLESICYGVIGGIVGDALGVGILYIINYFISPLKDYGIIEKPNITPMYLVYGLAFSMILSIVSAVIPIIKTNKLQVKEVILNTSNNSEKIGIGKFIIGCILLAAVIAINSIKSKWVLNISPILIIFATAAVMLIFPKIIDFISKNIFKRIKDVFSINALSLNNMRTSKVLLGNVNLLIIAIISIVIINSLSVSIKNVVSEAYEKTKYDLEISVPEDGIGNTKEEIENILKKQSGVNGDSIQQQCYANGKIDNNNFTVIGMEPDKYLDYDKYVAWDKKEYADTYNEFKNGALNGVILSEKVSEKTKLKAGDTFKMQLRNDTKEYKVVGVIDGKLYYNGVFILINFKGLPKEYITGAPVELFVNTSKDPAKVKEDINKSIKQLGGNVLTFEETRDKNIEANKQLMDILSIFSFMAVVIGAFGVLNNIGISFIQRKKDLAVLSSVGMSKFQRAKMLLIESILTVVWSIILVIPFSYLAISITTKITKLIGFDMEVYFNVSFIPIAFGVSLLLVLIATIPVLFKSKKLSIIEELKYE
ncbi:ABC transporter permease [Clostridium sp. 'White wine YQ']|uniref:ABC transporter permease n=1 Tax=Clostridium sp. 'White wine YQ' TaxID=3027474 RepID=UPI002366EDB9|nr:FtsX-like permease family protein [Clostridium sp. 'White wine YQ']MDD7794472.1 ABC transporter permease [Clostridium sp. 'White wine YQ']